MGRIYWLFNRFWVGRYKFPAISVKRFVKAGENGVDLDIQVIGVDHDGEQKAYPVNMIFFHHQIRMTSLDSQFGLLIAAYVAAAAYMT